MTGLARHWRQSRPLRRLVTLRRNGGSCASPARVASHWSKPLLPGSVNVDDKRHLTHATVVELPKPEVSCDLCVHALFDSGGGVVCSLVNEDIWFPKDTAKECPTFERDS